MEGCERIRRCCHIDRPYADMITRKGAIFTVHTHILLRQNELVMTIVKALLLSAMRMRWKQKKAKKMTAYSSGSPSTEWHVLMV